MREPRRVATRGPAHDAPLRAMLAAFGPFAAVLLLLALANAWLAPAPPPLTAAQRTILDAIRMVESSGRDDVRDGDDGRAIGPYQIHRAYWQDAVAAEPDLGGSYDDCRDRAHAERVVAAYMRRYAAAAWTAGDAETIARTHNGGPTGPSRDTTLPYWRRVRAHLGR